MGHAAHGPDKTKPHRFGSAVLGFGWAYLVVAIATNRPHLEDSLAQGSLSADAQYWIMSALAAVLGASLVMLAVHLVRMLITKGARRTNSRSLLVGAILALGLFYTPKAVWTTGYGMLDGGSQDFLAAAVELVDEALPSLNIDQISFTSSGGT